MWRVINDSQNLEESYGVVSDFRSIEGATPADIFRLLVSSLAL